jgi:hypothetical protein
MEDVVHRDATATEDGTGEVHETDAARQSGPPGDRFFIG